MTLDKQTIAILNDLYGHIFEYFVIEDLEGKRREQGMYGKYKATFYTTYTEEDSDEDGDYSFKTECKEVVLSIDKVDDFYKEYIGKKCYLI